MLCSKACPAGQDHAGSTLAESLALEFSRIQFTPDLMPADIIGTWVEDSAQGVRGEVRVP